MKNIESESSEEVRGKIRLLVLAHEITSYTRSERKKNLGDDYVDISFKEDLNDTYSILKNETLITSLEDFKAYSLWEAYFELYKDHFGVKARWHRWYDYDADGWRDKIASLPK